MTKWAIATVCLLGLVPSPGAPQAVRGRVVAENSRAAIGDATVSLIAPDSSVADRVASDKEGFFRFALSHAGSYVVRVERIGYQKFELSVQVGAEEQVLLPAILLVPAAIELDPVEARAERRAQVQVGFSRASHILAGQRLALLEQQNATIYSAARELGGGLRFRKLNPGGSRPLECIETTRRVMNFEAMSKRECDMVAVVVDGILVIDPLRYFQDVRLVDFESVEYVTPVEAGQLYGMEASAKGALVLWTRGRGPHISQDRNRR